MSEISRDIHLHPIQQRVASLALNILVQQMEMHGFENLDIS